MELCFEIWDLPRELRLMLDIILRKPVEEIPGDLDWEFFERLVRQHRVQPLLIRGIKALRPELVDACPVLKAWRGQQNRYAMESINRLKALAQVNGLLAANGIPMLSMKGPLLSMELYGDPSLRTSKDLDVMVAQEDMARAGALLKTIGFHPQDNPFNTTPLRRKYYGLLELEKHEVFYRDDVCLELHWRSNFQTEQSFESLWRSREERMVLGGKIAVLGSGERFPDLIIHAAEHGFLRLRWLLDLYELQKKPYFSWETVYDTMCRRGVGELLLETMLVMYRLDLPGLPDVCFTDVELRREGDCVKLTVSDDQVGNKAAKLSDHVYPLLLRDVQRGEREWRSYDRLLPTCINNTTVFQWFLIACGPSTYEFAWVDLPDWLFWAYFLLRPVNWVRRKLFGGKA